MATWRTNSFVVGSYYRVLKGFKTDVSSFDENEVLTFKDATYSRYDSSSAFIFETASGELKTWFLHDEDLDDSSARFTKVK